MWSLVMCHIKIIPSKALWNHAAFFKVCSINGITFLVPVYQNINLLLHLYADVF